MNRLEKILSKWNFKKIIIRYLVLGVLAGLACAGAVGYIYKERLNFAIKYSQIEEAKSGVDLKISAQKTANASSDVVDVLIIDSQDRVTYSAKKSEFSLSELKLTKAGSEKKYLVCDSHPNAAFKYVKSDEFMLNSIINKDFGKIRSDYESENIFENSLSSKTIYMLNVVKVHNSSNKVYVITVPTTVPGGMTALKTTAAVAMLFFCVYWALVALWLYKDAAKCRLSPLYWGLIGLFTNIIGLIVYKIYKRTMIICPSCDTAQNADSLYCSFCGKKLGSCCEKCGCKIAPKDNFCRRCGTAIK